jgi:hypothetical protein
MNLSGEAVSCLLKKENRTAEQLIVVSDDLALPLGTIRLRPKGSAGGHNGLKSIIACLRTEEFIRLRIGIEPEHPLRDTKDFVLENFSKTDLEVLCEPSKIPEFLEIDVANLEVNESVHVSDLHVGEGIELHELPETVVASIVVVKEEELEPQLETPDEPEIVGKDEKDGEDSEESES